MENPVESIAAVTFPVAYFDGEHEVDIGNVLVHPSLGFKKFKTIISRKIGIAPQQISVSLVRRTKSRSSPDTRRKVPIDESSDFAAISQERDCFVLAILKRSRRTRSQRRAMRVLDIPPEYELEEAAVAPLFPVKSILKRHPAAGLFDDSPFFFGYFPEEFGLGIWEYENHLQSIRRQREMYLMSTAAAYPPMTMVSLPEILPPVPSPSPAASVVCVECLEAEGEGRAADFHLCVYDAVIEGFRTQVGPIQRPPKQHVDT